MKILITGAKGQVGTELVKEAKSRGHDVFGFGSKELDISNFEQVKDTVQKIQPDVIINAAAYTAVDKAEEEKELAYAVNSLGSENLAKACKKFDIPLLHISTDYVYDGEKKEAYIETDQPNPTGVYGASKLEGDQRIQAIWHKHIILRVSWVFGENGNNFVKTMLRLANERDELSIVDDQFGAPTSARTIANKLLDILESSKLRLAQCPWGIYNFQSEPGVTWYQFSQEIFNQAYRLGLVNKIMKIEPIPSSEFPTAAKRPLNSKLDGKKILHYFDISPEDWRDELTQVLKNISI